MALRNRQSHVADIVLWPGDAGGARREQVRVQLCNSGDCCVPESEFFKRAAKLGIEDVRQALDCAIHAGDIYHESIDDRKLLFPHDLRDAELTIVRCSRHLAEGSRDKFKLVHSENYGATADHVIALLRSTQEKTTLCAADNEGAKSWAMKFGYPVSVLRTWLTSDASTPFGNAESRLSCATRANHIVLFDASRYGVESLAQISEATPQSTFVTLIGSLDETPINGHGQPFRDLVESKALHVSSINAAGCWGNPTPPAPSATKRSALVFRLQRAAELPRD